MNFFRICIVGLFGLVPMTALAAEPTVYERVVRPLFQHHCVGCHGPDKQKANLRLDSPSAIRTGGNSGPAIIPGKSAESLLIHALTGDQADVARMPPKGPALTDTQVTLLRRWIDAGAQGDDSATVEAEIPVRLAAGVVGSPACLVRRSRPEHWAFQPIRRPQPPLVRDESWARNPIDRFVLARLEKEQIGPSPEAEKGTLVRRVYLDLLGLLPAPAEVDAFVHDTGSDAYERMVDRVLANPHYGERWGRHWLDAARYADSNGFTIDAPRQIWKYRDWVIRSLNADLPFDEFTVEQLAGDLLPGASTAQLVATGFHRNTLHNEEGGIDVEQFRTEAVVDRVNTTGAVWLGLTVGCAQCHDHKFDPISQREYYQLFAFFNDQDEPSLEILTPELRQARERVYTELAKLETCLQRLDPTSPARVEKWERSQTDETRATLPKEIRALFEVAPNGRSPKQVQILEQAFRRADQSRHVVGGLGNPFAALAHAQILTTRLTLEEQREALRKQEPVAVTTLVLRERKTPRVTHVHLGGDFLRQGVVVQPATPLMLPALHPSSKPARPTRLDLASWLVAPENPLTARVTVNRIWGEYFGVGLVETDNDFGTQGTPPSHPELLDWLASEWMRQHWSMKAMHKLIVTSATYRQSSRARPELATRDPRNRLLARQARLRLDAEVVRDVALSAAGLLSAKIGGPSVFPPQPGGVYRFTQIQRDWRTSAGEDRYRRGMYTFFWRSAPHPALVTFDAPDSTTSCTRRNRSNTPLQALTLLNDSGFHEYAQGLASRLLREAPADDAARLQYAFRVCLARAPSDREQERLRAFLEAQRTEGSAGADGAGWLLAARVLLNLDEFITRE